MYYYNCRCELSDLLGKILTDASATTDEVTFTTTDGDVYKLLHIQDCCESVYIESIVGDLQDLVGEPILRAEEAEDLFDVIRNAGKEESRDESFTWTFYKLATRKGYVDIRWYGSSNGYYSERVDFIKVKDE